MHSGLVIDAVCEEQAALSEYFGDTILSFAEKSGLSITQVIAIVTLVFVVLFGANVALAMYVCKKYQYCCWKLKP